MIFDSGGAYGGYLVFSLTFSFVGSAFAMFLYLWYNGRLDMDEGPKIQMMMDEGSGEDDGR